MPSADLFEPRTDAEIREALDKARRQDTSRMRVDFQVAVDYLEGRQLDDVESELNARYERTQTGDKGGQIAAQTIPLTQRYVAEMATAYNRPVKRTLLGDDGKQVEKQTEQLNRMLAAASYDEHMHRVDEYSVLLKTCGLWYQARAGALRPVITWPHNIWPVLPDDDWASVADQADYAGHVIELLSAGEEGKGDRYAWVAPAETGFFSSMAGPFSPDAGGITLHGNVFQWPQTVDGATPLEGIERTLPLQMLTFWHLRLPVGELIVDSDPAIALANRELNLQLSILLDTLAHQGWATLLLNMLNPDTPPTTFSAGPRNGLVIGAGESANMLSSPVNYTDLVNVVSTWTRMLAIAMRQSPNDFSVQQQAAASGFAKLVDSLPKVEAREERIARLQAAEAQVAWPRLAAIGSSLGLISGSVEQLSQLRMHTEFAPLEFPLSVPEQAQKDEHEIKHGLTTPARILAKRRGITIEEAEAEVNANLGIDPDAEDVSTRDPFTGVQTTSMIAVTTAVAAKEIPREAGVQMMVTAYQVPREEAEALIGEAGRTFTAASVEAEKPAPAQPAQQPPTPPPPGNGSNGGGRSMLGSLIARRRGG